MVAIANSGYMCFIRFSQTVTSLLNSEGLTVGGVGRSHDEGETSGRCPCGKQVQHWSFLRLQSPDFVREKHIHIIYDANSYHLQAVLDIHCTSPIHDSSCVVKSAARCLHQ